MKYWRGINFNCLDHSRPIDNLLRFPAICGRIKERGDKTMAKTGSDNKSDNFDNKTRRFLVAGLAATLFRLFVLRKSQIQKSTNSQIHNSTNSQIQNPKIAKLSRTLKLSPCQEKPYILSAFLGGLAGRVPFGLCLYLHF